MKLTRSVRLEPLSSMFV